MNVVKIPMKELRKPSRNVRLHSNKQISEFKRSIEMFGQIRPIVVDEAYTILAGNGLYEALLALKRAEADCYVVSGLTEAEKKKLMLADNRIFSLGIDDTQAFDEILAELDNDFDIPGYDPELLQTISADMDSADEIICGYGTVNEEAKASMQRASAEYSRHEEEIAAVSHRVDIPARAGIVATAQETTSEQGHVAASPKKTLAGEPESEPRRQYLVCPKCGERIWL